MKNLVNIIGIAYLLCGCNTNSASTANQSSPANAIKHQQVTLQQPIITKEPPVFDVPSLLGVTIDRIKDKLGRPSQEEQSNASNTENYCVFIRGNYSLTINYNIATRKPDLFFVVNTRKKVSYSTLLAKSNADSLSTEYTVEYSIEPTIKAYPGLLVTADSLETR